MPWAQDGSKLIPGINDTWNEFQSFSKGKAISPTDWKLARARLYEEYENHIANGGLPALNFDASNRYASKLKFVIRHIQKMLTLINFLHVVRAVRRRGLTPRQVLDIYNLKGTGKYGRLGASIARTYGVTPKAVRDIWNGTTWSDLTSASHAAIIKSDHAHRQDNIIAESNRSVEEAETSQVCVSKLHRYFFRMRRQRRVTELRIIICALLWG